MALKIVGSNPTTHPTKKKDFHKKSFFFILGCSQVVRHHTLTVAFRWFESIQPNQTKKAPEKVLFCLVGILTSDESQPPAGGTSASLKCGRNLRFPHKRPLPDYGGQMSGEI